MENNKRSTTLRKQRTQSQPTQNELNNNNHQQTLHLNNNRTSTNNELTHNKHQQQ